MLPGPLLQFGLSCCCSAEAFRLRLSSAVWQFGLLGGGLQAEAEQHSSAVWPEIRSSLSLVVQFGSLSVWGLALCCDLESIESCECWSASLCMEGMEAFRLISFPGSRVVISVYGVVQEEGLSVGKRTTLGDGRCRAAHPCSVV